MTSKSYNIRSCLFAILLVIFCLSGCNPYSHPYILSDSFNKSSYKRIGLLVTRMGHPQYCFLSPITLNTNYSIKTAKPLIDIPPKEQIDVYIEEESRIRASLPRYPSYETRWPTKQNYFGNITPQLYNNLHGILEQKGYQVFNVREMMKDRHKPISEMTISEIISSLNGSVDALFVLHYIDRGDFEYNDLPRKSSMKGFTALLYTISMFNTNSQERVLYLYGECANIPYAIASDRDLALDPLRSNRVKTYNTKTEYPLGGSSATYYSSVSLDFTDEEVVQYVMNRMRTGIVFTTYDGSSSFSVEWKSIEALIP